MLGKGDANEDGPGLPLGFNRWTRVYAAVILNLVAWIAVFIVVAWLYR